MNLAEAEKLANEVLAAISPFCHQSMIVGSVRRKKLHEPIKDIECCAVPDNTKLFQLRDVVNVRWGRPSIGAFPSKYTRIRTHVNIDLFWCSPESYGLNCFIRTGPADYSARGLAFWKRITGGGYSKDARLHLPDGTIVPTPTEESVYAAMKIPFKNPVHRK